MSSDDSGGRNVENGSTTDDRASLEERKDVLVLVKTYPQPSQKYEETVCTAGIDGGGNWVRLYPISYRYLPYYKQFKKYQWITANLKKRDPNKDPRKESWTPEIDSNTVLGLVISPSNGWRERRQLLSNTKIYESVEELTADYYKNGTSLAILKPSRMLDFVIKSEDGQWSDKQAQVLGQLKLGFAGPQRKSLEKIPYRFLYRFTCDDSPQVHEWTIHDWEIYQLYLTLKNKYQYAADTIQEKMRQKWLLEMWGENKDPLLFVGTVHHRYKRPIFGVLGVFWPPKSSD